MQANTTIGDFVLITVEELVMLKGSQINPFTSVTGGKGKVTIGKNSVISYGVRIITRSDTPNNIRMNDDSPETMRDIRSGNVDIGDNCFVGANCVLMPGVIIGHRAVIGSGAYIDKNVGDGLIVIPKQKHTFILRKCKNHRVQD